MIDLTLFGTVAVAGPGTASRLPAQPKLFGLFAYLLLARPAGFHRRDRLIGLFWPDQPEGRARASLRTALHELREALGPEAIVARGDDEIAVQGERFRSDVAGMEEAIARGELAKALELYTGELLAGFLPGEAGLEQWLEARRQHYRGVAAEAAWSLATRSETATDLTAAAKWARKAARLAGPDERRIRRVLTLLVRAGDRAGAVAIYEEFERFLARDFQMRPDPETAALAAQIRGGRDPV